MLKIKRNISLKNLTTFRIGGKAKYFIEVFNKTDLERAIIWGRKKSLPFFIIGGGSNILISDKGYSGLVIKINNSRVKKIQPYIITVGAGMNLAAIEQRFFQEGWSGLEWARGIPGTVGGAVVGNAGAFGHSLQEIVRQVTTISLITSEEKIYSPEQCKFSYRGSIFKTKQEVVWEVSLQWQKGDKSKIKERRDKYWDYKVQKRHLFQYPSAGSIFKNILLKDTPYSKNFHPETNSLSGYAIIKGKKTIIRGGKLSAGWLIEQCGLKGYKIGQAEIAPFHGNVIINLGQAKSDDVLQLISLARKKVWQKFKIKLEEEVIIKNKK